MDRRTFLAGAGAALLVGPVGTEAQGTGKTYRIGILGNVPLTDPRSARLWGALAEGLRELGYVDARNITIEYLPSKASRLSA